MLVIFLDLNVLRIELILRRILLFMFKIHHYDISNTSTTYDIYYTTKSVKKNNVVYSHNSRTSNSYCIFPSTSSNFMSYHIHIWIASYNKININVSYPCFKKLSKVFLSNCD